MMEIQSFIAFAKGFGSFVAERFYDDALTRAKLAKLIDCV